MNASGSEEQGAGRVSRRDFLRSTAVAGVGLTVAVQWGCAPGEGASSGPVTTPFAPDAFVRVSTDGSVTVVCGYSEMGQGVLTAVPQLVAEELDVEWSKVRVEQSPAGEAYFNPAFGMQGTGGSTTVRASWKPMREAGARARAMLVAAAAQRWGVGPEACSTAAGSVLKNGSSDRLSYGELAEAAAAIPVPETVTLKDPKDFRILGKAVPRLDLPDKVVGAGRFGIDVKVPGLLVAVVERSPVFGGKPVKWDEAAAKAVPGVRQVVPISSGVAVIAEGYWSARKGREALKVEWDNGPNAGQSSQKISVQLAALVKRPGVSVRKAGAGAAPQAGKVVEAVYEVPYLAHACMEPMNATAHVEADKVTVWAPIQFQAAAGQAFGGGAREVAARIGGVPADQVTIHTTLLGGGFGRRFFLDFVGEALECSKAVAAPVKVVWSREDDIQHDFYRPVSTAWFRGTVSADGTPVSWVNRVACPAIIPAGPGKVDDSSHEGLSNFPYAIPNVAVEVHNPNLGVPTGFWRSVGSSQNAFFSECFVDELAQAAGKDPFEFRRGLLGQAPRHKRVLELAAEKAGWGTPLPSGQARGIAVAESFGSYVAQVAEVSMQQGVPRVHRVVAAIDCGPIVNPDIIAAQIESAVVYGLAAALYGEITIEGGRSVQGNFDLYRMLRINEMPVVE
ncbi:MAG TPA: molybdopterin cofactor-binding domain-containing protein, partial [Gemmatimonadales bacterium]